MITTLVLVSKFKSKLIPQLLTDINECNTNNGGCEQICTNTMGSYECSCSPRYLLSTNGHSCLGMEYNCSVWLIILIKTLVTA